MIEIFTLYLGIILTLIFIGYGLTALLLPNSFMHSGLWIAPWLSMILISLIGFMMHLGNMNMDEAGYIFIIIVAFILLIYSLIGNKKLAIFTKENLILLILFVIGSYLYSIIIDLNFAPIIKNVYLLHHPLIYKLFKLKDLSFDAYKIVPFILPHFFAALFHVNIINIVEIMQPLFTVLLFYPIYIFLKNYFFKNRTYCLITLFSIFLLSLILISNYIHFILDQILFIGIGILLIILILEYIHQVSKENNNMNLNNFDLLLAFCLSFLFTTQPEVFKIILFLFFILFIYFSFIQKKEEILYVFGKIVVLSLIINPVIVGIALRI